MDCLPCGTDPKNLPAFLFVLHIRSVSCIINKIHKDVKDKMKKRFGLLDSMRGILVLNMIAYHTLWDMVYLFDFTAPWYRALPGRIWQRCICCGFILLSGFCWSLGSHRLRRALTVFGAGALVTVVTLIASPATAVIFGILTLLGSCMLILIPLSRLFEKLPPVPMIPVCFVLYEVCAYITSVGLGPNRLYCNYLTAYLGFPFADFSSGDYFPLFPWLFLFLCGYFLYRAIEAHLSDFRVMTATFSPLAFVGRHSLIFYLLHQPIIYAVLWLVNHNLR